MIIAASYPASWAFCILFIYEQFFSEITAIHFELSCLGGDSICEQPSKGDDLMTKPCKPRVGNGGPIIEELLEIRTFWEFKLNNNYFFYVQHLKVSTWFDFTEKTEIFAATESVTKQITRKVRYVKTLFLSIWRTTVYLKRSLFNKMKLVRI